ncbi:acetolactate synthase large subunit [Halomicrobium sp. HM KBTZ05]|uniref:acetolactate synthase large subunit n=1 Tax=Halomicrobium sp. HM KBTZ05 TaxID=3242663 RepID=UPI0035567CE4
MQVSDLLVASLEREGVEHVFGLPGEELEDLLFSLRESTVTFVPVRHEQGAAFMADVHGRLTGDAGVCLSTLGPGATNLLTGVADAHLDKSPLVAITGQGGLERLHQESHQAIDVLQTFASVTKWNTQLDSSEIVHESVRKAFKVAEHEKPGATHMELPEDVAGGQTETEPMAAGERIPIGAPAPDSLDRAETLLAESERPILLVGNGVVRTDASEQLREFVDATDAPVVSTYMGKGAVSDDDDRSLMTLDSGSNGEPARAIEAADLVLTLGYDIAEHDPGDWYPGTTPLVHVDSEPAEVYEAYGPDVEIVADVGETLGHLTDWCRAGHPSFERDWYDDLREQIVADVDDEPVGEPPFTVRSVLPVLRSEMASEDVLVSDVGSHKMAIAQNFPTYEPNTCIVSNGFASMGIAVPGGLAADLAVDSNVVAACGDGGFMMNAAEIETATRFGCEYTILLFVDDDYGLISQQQQAHTGESFGTELTNPEFQTLAESFGIEGYRPESATEIRDALRDAIDGGLSLVEIPVA